MFPWRGTSDTLNTVLRDCALFLLLVEMEFETLGQGPDDFY